MDTFDVGDIRQTFGEMNDNWHLCDGSASYEPSFSKMLQKYDPTGMFYNDTTLPLYNSEYVITSLTKIDDLWIVGAKKDRIPYVGYSDDIFGTFTFSKISNTQIYSSGVGPFINGRSGKYVAVYEYGSTSGNFAVYCSDILENLWNSSTNGNKSGNLIGNEIGYDDRDGYWYIAFMLSSSVYYECSTDGMNWEYTKVIANDSLPDFYRMENGVYVLQYTYSSTNTAGKTSVSRNLRFFSGGEMSSSFSISGNDNYSGKSYYISRMIYDKKYKRFVYARAMDYGGLVNQTCNIQYTDPIEDPYTTPVQSLFTHKIFLTIPTINNSISLTLFNDKYFIGIYPLDDSRFKCVYDSTENGLVNFIDLSTVDGVTPYAGIFPKNTKTPSPRIYEDTYFQIGDNVIGKPNRSLLPNIVEKTSNGQVYIKIK